MTSSLCRSTTAALACARSVSRTLAKKPTTPKSIPSLFPSPKRTTPFCASRIVVALGCVESLMPLHSVIASARLKSSIALDSTCWSCLSRGGLTPCFTPDSIAVVNRSAQVARSPPAVPVQLQAPGSSFPMIVDGHRGVNTTHVARSNVLNELPSGQNWRPAGRMRGALSGQAYSAALNQYMVQPTQSVQATSPPPHTALPFSVSQQLQILISNNINSHGSSQQAQTRTGGAAAGQGHRP
ncbi:hypothetical protein IFM89_024071 [Coptis chinensis]|uniref:Uncharacterized protein n=1 Tax=Coptis chinensis TaxID=261450 RepID=A0A835LSU5_9MAGN|nr:hypothetical protein IFM89_024071 [Coptis chinensis]